MPGLCSLARLGMMGEECLDSTPRAFAVESVPAAWLSQQTGGRARHQLLGSKRTVRLLI